MKTWQLHYSYSDQFGHERREVSQHYTTPELAAGAAAVLFAVVSPDAWWIEETVTVEFHTKH